VESLSFAGSLILETLFYWLPAGLLAFGAFRSRGRGRRIVCVLLLCVFFIVIFAGDLALHKNVGFQMLVAAVGTCGGAALGRSARKDHPGALSVTSQTSERERGKDEIWADIRRLLVCNPNLTPDYVDREKAAILWRWETEHQLPNCDMDLFNTFGRYLSATQLGDAPSR
jgi:hypothetical protein